MNQLEHEAKLQQLQEAEKRICDIKGTLHYTQMGMPRQKPLTSHTEEDLFKQAFMFGVDNYRNKVKLTQLQYNGKNIDWTPRIELLTHFCFAKGRISFENLHQVLFNQPEKITA